MAAFLLTIGVLVSFHEFGHFFVARCCGVKVLRFALGFGKPLFTYHAKNGTEWVIGGIPMGGYVKLLDGRDEGQKIAPHEKTQSFDAKPLWQRSAIVAAGPLANFVLAIILFTVIYVSGVPQLPARLQAPPEHSVAASLGIAVGDQVVGWKSGDRNESQEIDAQAFISIPSWNALRWELMDALTGKQGFSLELQSDTGGRYVKHFPAAELPEMQPGLDPFQALGILPQLAPASGWTELKLTPLDALEFAVHRVWLIGKVSARLMVGLFTGSTSIKQLSGPLSIADMAGKSAQIGWQPFVAFLALMSISIGLLNLVPLPMLDGGQLLYDAWELVVGKRITVSMQARLQKVGLVLVLSFSLLALFNDLQRYLSP
ncbi:M50 family metallopeptidase [Polynucleobacter meluiroseus]|uniref:M50 family metallopeptidase n=1 Tax=Polynucleobacter meluiroseus TaxID=1938814 RepID=UPI002350B4D6|nr:site-2 protease family protein [Polynucleobacter meluiroseus]